MIADYVDQKHLAGKIPNAVPNFSMLIEDNPLVRNELLATCPSIRDAPFAIHHYQYAIGDPPRAIILAILH